MRLREWRCIAASTVLSAASFALAATPTHAQSAAGPVISLSASPNPALSDADNVYFDAEGTHDSGCSITKYSFDFGDGVISDTTYPYAYHYFHASGSAELFTVRLTVSDSCHRTSTKSLVEHVDEDTPPVASLNITYSSSNSNEIWADASGSTANAEASPYEFDFVWGDGSDTPVYVPTESTSHTYKIAGSYTVTVHVYDYAELESSTSTSVSVPSAAEPTAPSNVEANAGNSKVSLVWSAPKSGGTPSSYVVTASPGGQTKTVAGTLLNATFTGLANGTTYSFTVAANEGGSSSVSEPSNPVTPTGAPGAPTAVTAAADDTDAVVSWQPPGVTGANPRSHHQGLNYIVTTFPGGAQTIVTGTPAPTSTTISGLKEGILYHFTVAASNSSLTGAASQASNMTKLVSRGPTITQAPHWKLVKPSTVGTSATNLPLNLTVLWSGEAGSTAICTYTLQHSVDNGPWVTVATVPATTTTASDTIPAPRLLVRYQVRATACNNVDSSWVQSPEFSYQLFEENNATKFTYSGTWTRIPCSECAGGYDESSTAANAVATLSLNAAYNVGLVFSVGPDLGSADIYEGTRLLGVVNTYASTAGYRSLLFKTGWATFGIHSIRIVNLATVGHPGLDLDGALTLYAPLARL